jgi:integrase
MLPLKLFNPAVARDPINPATITVADVVDAYLAARAVHFRLGSLREKSFRAMKETLDDFAEALGNRQVAGLKNQHLLDWLLAHDWRSPHTLAHRQGIVVTCFRWAADEDRGLIPRCPFRRTSKAFKKPRPRAAITPDEYAAIMATTRAMLRGEGPTVHRESCKAFRRAMAFLWVTGARTCEMRAIRWRDIDWVQGVIRLDDSKTSEATGQPRIIPLDAMLCRLLRWRRGKPDQFVFLNGRGRPWKCPGFARLFRRYGQFAGIRVVLSPYSLRHGFCVRALVAGVGQRQIADVMGHSTTRYIEWYGRSARENASYLKGVLEDIDRGRE